MMEAKALTPSIDKSQGQLASERIRTALALLGKGTKSVREMRALILGLEAAMQAMPSYVPGEEFTTLHHFSPGVYTRECHIPADFIVTGRIHKTAHLNLLLKGKITVWTEDGMKTLTAPAVIHSQPGIKRVGYAHEDTIWTTVHANPADDRTIKNVEARLFAESFDDAYLASERTLGDALMYLGFSPEEAWEISNWTTDRVEFDSNITQVRVDKSPVHGLGLFSAQSFEAGQVIVPARIAGKRTPAGRYSNHSGNPNSKAVMRENGDVDLVAIKPIASGDEIFSDYYFNFTNSRKSQEENKLCHL